MADHDRSNSTHFGFREVGEEEKSRLVGGVFRSVAERYDLMNDLMSAGVHRLWKDLTVLQSGVHAGQSVLDVAGGSGDLAARLAQRVGPRGHVVLSDINEAMLERGRARLADRGIVGNVDVVQADAEALPFADNAFHCVTIGFGLRNVTRLPRALASMHRVLKPGGRLFVLEFSRPPNPVLRTLYDAYSFTVLPRLGRVVARDEQAYRYLVESIRRHPDQEQLSALMTGAGFERVRYLNLTGGVVALHQGVKL